MSDDDYDSERDNPYIRMLGESHRRYHAHNKLVGEFNQLRKLLIVVLAVGAAYCLYMALSATARRQQHFYAPPGRAYADQERRPAHYLLGFTRVPTQPEAVHEPSVSVHFPTR